jgi:hypothetical protein
LDSGFLIPILYPIWNQKFKSYNLELFLIFSFTFFAILQIEQVPFGIDAIILKYLC